MTDVFDCVLALAVAESFSPFGILLAHRIHSSTRRERAERSSLGLLRRLTRPTKGRMMLGYNTYGIISKELYRFSVGATVHV